MVGTTLLIPEWFVNEMHEYRIISVENGNCDCQSTTNPQKRMSISVERAHNLISQQS